MTPPSPSSIIGEDGLRGGGSLADSASLTLRLETFLPYRLNVLSAAILRSLGGIFDARFGISIPEWRVIAALGQFGTMTAKQVGIHSRMHKTKVSRAVATLERRNLLARRSNKADLREAFLSLTDAGAQLYHSIVPVALDFGEKLTADLDPAQQAVFDQVVNRLLARAVALGAASSITDDELD